MAKYQPIDIQQEITDYFIKNLENVTDGWEMPFFGGGGATNVVTKKAYRGINQIVLSFKAYERGYSTDYWATANQFFALGGGERDGKKVLTPSKYHVRKGEKATRVILWKTFEKENAVTGETETFPVSRAYPVFNADQIEGYEPPVVEVVDNTVKHAHADEFLAALNITTEHSSKGRAFYVPSKDFVHMPNRENFRATKTSTATDAYYSTLAHEYVHATMHKSRLDRDAKDYAKEELVAEIGAAMVMGYLGLNNTVRDDHIKYVKSWLKHLKDDKKFIVQAASKAQKALDWMIEQQADELAQAA